MAKVTKNGWIDPYPHNDLLSPCTGPCCIPEAYGPPPHWTCQIFSCLTLLNEAGICNPCTIKKELKEKGAGAFVRKREATFEPGELINDIGLSQEEEK